MYLENINTKFLGKENFYYKEIDSTQLEIYRRIENNEIKNGITIIADIQTQGKGTHGRIWHTDEENNIAFSFYIKTECQINKIEGITLEIAQTILETFDNLYNIQLQIKEPNDIIYNNKKIGGILTETKLQGETVKYIVVGIGINANKESFSKDIQNIATSIKKEFKIQIDCKEFIKTFITLFEEKIIKRIGEI